MKHTDIGDSILYAKCADVHEPLITSVSAITFTSKKTTRFNFTTLTGDKKPLPTQIFFEGKIYIYISIICIKQKGTLIAITGGIWPSLHFFLCIYLEGKKGIWII